MLALHQRCPTLKIHCLQLICIYYGDYVWDLIQKNDPHFTLHDTPVSGRPGVQLVEDHFWKTESEAVFVVSNEKYKSFGRLRIHFNKEFFQFKL